MADFIVLWCILQIINHKKQTSSTIRRDMAGDECICMLALLSCIRVCTCACTKKVESPKINPIPSWEFLQLELRQDIPLQQTTRPHDVMDRSFSLPNLSTTHQCTTSNYLSPRKRTSGLIWGGIKHNRVQEELHDDRTIRTHNIGLEI